MFLSKGSIRKEIDEVCLGQPGACTVPSYCGHVKHTLTTNTHANNQHMHTHTTNTHTHTTSTHTHTTNTHTHTTNTHTHRVRGEMVAWFL